MTAKSTHSPLTGQVLRSLGGAVGRTIGKNRVCVITYHRVLPTPEPLLASEPDIVKFRWQMELLARCFRVIPLHDALRAVEAGKVPDRAVCITFDDGYRSVHDLAAPILREFGLPATVFVASGFIDRGSMWNDRIIEAVRALPAGELDLSGMDLGTYTLGSIEERLQAVERLVERSKYLPPAVREETIVRLETLAGIDPEQKPMMTRDMLLGLDRQGIEIGAHTVTHPILTSLDDDSARHEIAEGKAQLESILGKPVRLFAYPNGKVGKDFDERHVAMVREEGFSAAFTTAIGALSSDQDPYQLPRGRPWDERPLMFGLRLLSWLAQKNP